VPLRILGLGKNENDVVQADVYLMTDVRPSLFPNPNLAGLRVDYDQPASDLLLSDLRSDKGMDWVPQSAWLTKIGIDVAPKLLGYDLAVDATGQGHPSAVAAGLVLNPAIPANTLDSGGGDLWRWLPGLFFIGSSVGFVFWLIAANPTGFRPF
jgi:hypothetical protein